MRALSFALALFSSASFKLRTPPNTSSRASRMFRKAAAACLALAGVTAVAGAQTASKLAINGQTDLVSAGYVNFGASPVGTAVTQNVTLKWTGTGTLAITSVTTPTQTVRQQQFTVTANNCNSVISGGTCTVSLKFVPAYVGYQTSPLIVSGGTTATTFRFGLNGVGGGPQAVFMPGILSTIAGKGTFPAATTPTTSTTTDTYTGDGGVPTAAQVNARGFRFDALGNLYIAEDSAGVIRKIVPVASGIANGTISTVAGTTTTAANGTTTSTTCAIPTSANAQTCGDGNAATAATFGATLPDVAFDSAGNMYIADLLENKVRRVDAVTNIVTTIAGNGVVPTANGGAYTNTGDGGVATSASINTPEGVYIDSQDNIYILLSNNLQPNLGTLVRRVASTNLNILTVAGSITSQTAAVGSTTLSTDCLTTAPCGDGGSATAAAVKIGVSGSFYLDPISDTFWIADRDANRIRMVVNPTPATATTGTITTVAGTGAATFSGDTGKASAATMNSPHGVVVDPAGDLYISDTNNNRIRWVNGQGNINTLVGSGATCTPAGATPTSPTCGDGGLATAAAASVLSYNLMFDPLGNLIVADEGHDEIRQVTMNPAIALNFGSIAVGDQTSPALQENLTNIGSSTLTFSTPASGQNANITTTGPTAAASMAFNQSNLTSCGPVTPTSQANNTLTAGNSCTYYLAFKPDTAQGNYTGTLVETDDSFNAGDAGNTLYTTPATQTINLTGAATTGTTTVGVTSSLNPSYYGQSVTFTATVTGGGAAPTGTVTFFDNPSAGGGNVALGSGTLSTTGGVTTATFTTSTTTTPTLPVGTDSITAVYNGDGNYASGTTSPALSQKVTQAPVPNVDLMTAVPGTISSGAQDVLTFKVPVAPGATPPIGTVSFTVPGPSNTTITLASGLHGTLSGGFEVYTTTTTALPVSSSSTTPDVVTGTISSGNTDPNYADGSLTANVLVNPNSTTNALVANPTAITIGSSDTLTYYLQAVTGSVPSGTVSFTSGNTSLNPTATPNGVAFPANATTVSCPTSSGLTGSCYTVSISTTALPLAISPATTTPVQAVFTPTGTSGYTTGTATTNVTVNMVPPNPGDALTAAQGTISVGTADQLTFAIQVVSGVPVPAGTVTFTAPGNVALGSNTWANPTPAACPAGSGLTGTCYLLSPTTAPTNIPLSVNSTTPTVVTANFVATSVSGYATGTETTPVQVNPAPTTDTLTALNPTTTFGTSDPLTFSIPVSAGAPAPVGTVTFTGPGGVVLQGSPATFTAASTPTNGFYTVTIPANNIPVGSPTTVMATFTATPGSGSGYATGSATTMVTVNKVPPTSDSIAANPPNIMVGGATTITFSVPNVLSTPPATSATVAFSYTTGAGGPATPLTGTVAVATAGGITTYSLTTNALPANNPSTTPDSVTGVFSGDSNYQGTTLSTPVNVGLITPNGVLTASPAMGDVYSNPVTLTETVQPNSNNGACPSGTVTFTYVPMMGPSVPLGTGTFTKNAAGCQATTMTTSLPVGSDTVAANAPGDSNFAPISSTTVVPVGQTPPPSVNLSLNPTTSTFGQSVTATFTIQTVQTATNGLANPTGTVVFTTAAGQQLGSQTLSTTGTGANSVTSASISTSSLPVGQDVVIATYGGDVNYMGAAPQKTETVNSITPVSTLSANPPSTTYGTPVTVTVSVQPSNGTCPAGPATFYSTSNNTPPVLGMGPVALNGTGTACVASIVVPLLPVGTDPISATIPASNGFLTTTPTPITVTISQAVPTNHSLTNVPAMSIFGQNVTLTETLSATGNGVVPTGMVQFSYNNGGGIVTLGAPVPIAGGQAVMNTMTLPVGTQYPVSAAYLGDTNYSAVTDSAMQTVSSYVPNAGLTAGPNPTTFGTPVTLTETIAPNGGLCPTGPVTFNNTVTNPVTVLGTGVITLMNGSCVATLTAPNLPVGTNPITATVPSSNGFAPITSGPQPVVINPSTLQDTLTTNINPSVFGTSIAITDTIPEVGNVPPTGTVTFYNYGVSIGNANVLPVVTNGVTAYVATLNTSTLPVGPNALTATYAGDNNDYGLAQSNQYNQVVSPVTTSPDLEIGPNPSTFGQTVTLSETIPVINGTPATGQIAFYEKGTFVGNGTLTNGVAKVMTSTLPVGVDQITAVYPGDANYAGGSPTPKNATVNPSINPDVLTVQPPSQAFGMPVVLTDTIPVEGGVPPTGTVTFYNNGVQIGTPQPVNAQGVATLTTTTLPVGTDPITATLSADVNYAQVTSNTVNANIYQGTTSPGLTAMPNPSPFGSNVTLTETVPGINGVTPTGTVTFYYAPTGGTPVQIGLPVTLTNGVAQIGTTTLPIGNDPLTASYSGDGNYQPATSASSVMITQVPANDSLTANPNSLPFGSPTVLTFTVTPVNNVTPTGTVSFYYGSTLLGTGSPNAMGVVMLSNVNSLPLGIDTVTAKYPGDNTYSASAPIASVTVTPATPISTVTVPTGPQVCGTPVTLMDTLTLNGLPIAAGGTVQFYDNGNPIGGPVPVPASGIVSLSTTSLSCSAPNMITAIYTPPANSPYNPSTGGPQTVTVGTLTPGSTVTSSPTTPLCGTSVTLTDTLTTVNGVPLTPGGTVQFYDNGVKLGGPVTVPASGIVTIMTTSLSCSTPNVITAIYTPPANSAYGPVTSPPTTVNVVTLDFTIAATPPTQTINPGDTAAYTVSLSGNLGFAFNSPVTLTAKGLPPGATVSFANGTYTPGVGPTNTTMTIVTAPDQASLRNSEKGGLNEVYYGLLLLPLLGVRRVRRKLRALPKGITYGLAALALLGGLGAMTGCGGGYFGPAPATYTITVTGTSGNLTHSTTVTLTVR